MRLLAISDLHGDLEAAREAARRFAPDVLLCCGDWGDAGEVVEDDLVALAAERPVLSTYGNHDPLPWLGRVRNRDGSSILLEQGETREIEGLRVAAIGGIWAKSHRKVHYVTDADVAAFADRIAAAPPPIDILLTHGCPAGYADRTPGGRHGGQRCFLDAFHRIAPRLHLCGHLHVAQERSTPDGRRVINVGSTPDGDVVVIEADASGGLEARRERFARPERSP